MECTNKLKIKHYLSKVIQTKIMSADYDVSAAIEGRYVKMS